MMKLVADSGSTKSIWVVLEDSIEKSRIMTAGMNPYFHTSASLEAVINAELIPFLTPDHIREIHFYGAGCSTEKNDDLVRDALLVSFHKARVHVYHDILGAARALFGHNEGISCILGTGCNCCYYDGIHIHTVVDSLGYLFGDEGAGSYLGKKLMEHYLKRQLPNDLSEAFDAKYHLTLEDILNALYNRPFPNRFLASFSEFIAPNQDHPFIHNLVREAFFAFLNAQVKYYPQYRNIPVSFVGSIAWFYRNILEGVMRSEGIQIGSIVQAPIEGLIKYHTS